MKKNIIIRITSLLHFVLFVAFGCETEKILFNGPYHVRFTEENITKKESFSEPIKIEVHLADLALTEDITINYSVTGSAREGIDYTIANDQNTVTIKKGQYLGYIEVQLINNANNILRSQDVIFTLQSVSNSKLQVGQGPSAIGKTFSLTIQDDCILAGTYKGSVDAFKVPVEGIEVSSTDCETYLVSNWNIDFFSPPYDYSLTFIDNGDNTITIPEQIESNEESLVGEGIVDPITGKITFDLTHSYKDENDEDVEESYTFTLTRSL